MVPILLIGFVKPDYGRKLLRWKEKQEINIIPTCLASVVNGRLNPSFQRTAYVQKFTNKYC